MRRIYSIDTLKFIAAFLVVFIHAPMDNFLKEYVLIITRVAVPIFFLISGFLYENKLNDKEKAKLSIKKLIKLLLFAYLIYIPFELFVYLSDGKSINDFFADLFSFNSIVFNLKIGFHLWYIRALIYLEIFYFFIKRKNSKIYYIIFPCVVYILSLVFFKYSLVFFGKTIPVEIYEPISKYLGTGYVFFTIGIFIKQYMNNMKKSKNFICILLIVFFTIMNFIEYILLEKFGKNVDACNYLNTFFLSISIFYFFISNPNFGKDTFFETIGREHSLNIYIYHIIIMRAFNFCVSKLGFSIEIWKSIRTIIIFIMSIIFSFIINKIENSIRKVKVDE